MQKTQVLNATTECKSFFVQKGQLSSNVVWTISAFTFGLRSYSTGLSVGHVTAENVAKWVDALLWFATAMSGTALQLQLLLSFTSLHLLRHRQLAIGFGAGCFHASAGINVPIVVLVGVVCMWPHTTQQAYWYRCVCMRARCWRSRFCF